MDGPDSISDGLLRYRYNDNLELQRRNFLCSIETLQRLLGLRLSSSRNQLLQRDKVGSFHSHDSQTPIDVNLIHNAPFLAEHLWIIKSFIR